MRGALLAGSIVLAMTAAAAAEEAAPAAPAAGPNSGSVVIQQEEGGLVFDVPLPRQRSLRERDPKFDRMLKGLPDLGTEDVPFKEAWTEKIVNAFNDQLKNGPGGGEVDDLDRQKYQRMQQMDTDTGPQDDWTWTPPSR
jgi:hypothetical protein